MALGCGDECELKERSPAGSEGCNVRDEGALPLGDVGGGILRGEAVLGGGLDDVGDSASNRRLRRTAQGLGSAGGTAGAAGRGGSVAAADADAATHRALQAMLERHTERHKLKQHELAALIDPLAWFRLQARHAPQFEAQHRGPGGALGGRPAEAGRDARALAAELTTALRYAGAAYGVAMADGHMDSVLRTTYMWTARPLVTGVDIRSTCTATQDSAVRAQIGAGELLHSDWSGGVFRPTHFVAFDPGRNWLVLAVRGTLRPDDLLTDACAAPCPFESGFAHEGVSRAAQYVVNQAAGVLAAAVAQRPGCEIVLTGHSMGAATATLAASLLRSLGLRRQPGASVSAAFSRARCIAFAPLPVLSEALASSHDQQRYTLSVVCGADFAPRLSMPALSLLREELCGAGIPATLGRGVRRLRRMMDVGGMRPPSPPRADAASGQIAGDPERLQMGGRVLYLRSARKQPSWHGEPTALDGVGCWATPEDFERLWLTEGCLSDHLVSHYQNALVAFAESASHQEVLQQRSESQQLGEAIVMQDIAHALEAGEGYDDFKERYRPVGGNQRLSELWLQSATAAVHSDSVSLSSESEDNDKSASQPAEVKKGARLKALLDPHEAAGFPRGLRQVEAASAAAAAADKQPCMLQETPAPDSGTEFLEDVGIDGGATKDEEAEISQVDVVATAADEEASADTVGRWLKGLQSMSIGTGWDEWDPSTGRLHMAQVFAPGNTEMFAPGSTSMM